MKDLKSKAQSASLEGQQTIPEDVLPEVQTFSAEGVQITHMSPENLRELLKNLKGEELVPGCYNSETNEIRTLSFSKHSV